MPLCKEGITNNSLVFAGNEDAHEGNPLRPLGKQGSKNEDRLEPGNDRVCTTSEGCTQRLVLVPQCSVTQLVKRSR